MRSLHSPIHSPNMTNSTHPPYSVENDLSPSSEKKQTPLSSLQEYRDEQAKIDQMKRDAAGIANRKTYQKISNDICIDMQKQARESGSTTSTYLISFSIQHSLHLKLFTRRDTCLNFLDYESIDWNSYPICESFDFDVFRSILCERLGIPENYVARFPFNGHYNGVGSIQPDYKVKINLETPVTLPSTSSSCIVM